MAYRPKHRTQLWRPETGRVDCGPRTWQHAIDVATRSHDVPGIDRVRALAGVSGPQTTNVYDADRAFERLHLRYARKVNAAWDLAVQALRDGKGLHLCVAYGVINDRQPSRSGDRAFRGGHSIYVQELRRTRTGQRIVLSFDSLYDGRRREIPDGPQWVRLGVLGDACEAFAGHRGRFWGGIVPVGATGGALPDVDPDETVIPADPDETPDEGTPLPPRLPDAPPDEGDDELDYQDEDEPVEVLDDDVDDDA